MAACASCMKTLKSLEAGGRVSIYRWRHGWKLKARQASLGRMSAVGKSCAKSVGGSTTYSFPHPTLDLV